MEVAEIQSYARQLYEAQGAKAIAEAAQKAAAFERQGKGRRADLATDRSRTNLVARATGNLKVS